MHLRHIAISIRGGGICFSFIDPISADSHVLPPGEAVTVGERDKRPLPDVWCAKGNYGTQPGRRQLAKLWTDFDAWEGARFGTSESGEGTPPRVLCPKSLDLTENECVTLFRNDKSS